VARLRQLQEHLGAGLAEIVATLIAQLDTATAGIEAGLASNEMDAVAVAAHAARNSALLLDARPLLDALRTVEIGARDHEPEVARSGLTQLQAAWPALRQRLEAEVHRSP
jgi:hypothetical protein